MVQSGEFGAPARGINGVWPFRLAMCCYRVVDADADPCRTLESQQEPNFETPRFWSGHTSLAWSLSSPNQVGRGQCPVASSVGPDSNCSSPETHRVSGQYDGLWACNWLSPFIGALKLQCFCLYGNSRSRWRTMLQHLAQKTAGCSFRGYLLPTTGLSLAK